MTQTPPFGNHTSHLTDINKVLEDILPDGSDFGPDCCAVCGRSIIDPDLDAPYIPIQLPVETRELMANSDVVTITEETVALRLRFCDDHWHELKQTIGKPQAVPFSRFNMEYISTATATIQDALSDGKPARSSRWDQDKLRLARDRVYNPSEASEIDERIQLESTLVVAAFDVYGLEYGSTERAKERLKRRLREFVHKAKRLKDGWLDIEFELDEADEPVTGSVFVISPDTKTIQYDDLSSWDLGPERLVSDTTYLPISRKGFTGYASEASPDSPHVGFYWLQDQNTWRWYPFPEDYTTGFGSDDRQYLPIQGPTGDIPALPIKELNEETVQTAGYEERLSGRWESIEISRPWIDRARDKLRRQLMK